MRLKPNIILFGAEFYSSCFPFPRKAKKNLYMPTFVSDTSSDRR